MVNRHSQTKYIVLKNGVAIPGAASKLYNTTTELPTAVVGSGAFYIPVAGSGNYTEATGAVGNAIQFVQRRDMSQDKSPLYKRPWEQTDWINAFCTNGINISVVNAALGSNDLHLVGNTATDIVPQDNFTFKLQVSGHGDRTDWYNSSYTTPTTFGYYTTPDFSATAYATVQQRDIIVEELCLDFNNKSRDMSFAIAICSSGSAVGTGATPIADLGNGTVPVGTTVVLGFDKSGNQHSFVLTLEMQQSFAALDTRLAALGFATADLVPYVGLNSTNIPAGYNVAGTLTNACDLIAVMALDEGQAAFDFRMQTKRRIEVGLVDGFDSVPQERIIEGSEGQGYGRQLAIQYRMHNRYEETHRSRMPYQSYHIEFPSFINEAGFYDYFVVEHCDGRTATSGMPNVNMATTIIAVPNYTVGSSTSDNPFWTGVLNAQRTYVLGILNAFITNNSLGLPALV